jgi:hypothetical protein
MERESLVLADLRAQVVGEESVVAVPAPLGIEGDDEEVRALGPLEKTAGLRTSQAGPTLNRDEVLPKGGHEAYLRDAAGPELEDETAHLGECVARERTQFI